VPIALPPGQARTVAPAVSTSRKRRGLGLADFSVCEAGGADGVDVSTRPLVPGGALSDPAQTESIAITTSMERRMAKLLIGAALLGL
jgi:hypothetical protein